MSTSDTPRTDAEEARLSYACHPGWVASHFARTLERELNDAKALLEDHGPNGRNVTNEQHQALRDELNEKSKRIELLQRVLWNSRYGWLYQ